MSPRQTRSAHGIPNPLVEYGQLLPQGFAGHQQRFENLHQGGLRCRSNAAMDSGSLATTASRVIVPSADMMQIVVVARETSNAAKRVWFSMGHAPWKGNPPSIGRFTPN